MGEEIEEGNVEYKLKLVDPTPERLEHVRSSHLPLPGLQTEPSRCVVQLTSQLKWRLFEGSGEAFYEIGIEDNGTARGLSPADLDKSIQVRAPAGNCFRCVRF
jgi:GTPase